eukprot:TRINITY_DN184_c0_g1_i2.p1 TRINITY_DN184_c0_g1~~TRINITY_DN184_c0_g1_i2.p1  ORF type:complete len:322 (+),score=15.06 TRINITY_DN184_c0_g1_i2:641-1606(+)
MRVDASVGTDGTTWSPAVAAVPSRKRAASSPPFGSLSKRGRHNMPFRKQAQPWHAVKKLLQFVRDIAGVRNGGSGADVQALVGEMTHSRQYRDFVGDPDDDADYATVGRNIVAFAASLPARSSVRRLLAAVGGVGLPVGRVSVLFKISKSAVRRTRVVPWGLFASRGLRTEPIKRKRVADGVRDKVRQFWSENSRPSATRTVVVRRGSNERVPVRYQTKTTKNLYADFRQRHPDIRGMVFSCVFQLAVCLVSLCFRFVCVVCPCFSLHLLRLSSTFRWSVQLPGLYSVPCVRAVCACCQDIAVHAPSAKVPPRRGNGSPMP